MTNSNLVDLSYRLRTRASIRRNIPHRKSVQEGVPDRLADLLDESADAIDKLRSELILKEAKLRTFYF